MVERGNKLVLPGRRLGLMKLAVAILLAGCGSAAAVAPLSSSSPSSPGSPEVRITPASGAVQIAIAEGSVCARMVNGTVRCWGENVGDGTRTEQHTPVEVNGITDAVDLVLGLAQACVKRATGDVLCWGSTGFLDIPAPEHASDVLIPTPAHELDRAARLWGSGHGDGCARWSDGTTKCWGMGPGTLAVGQRSSNGPTPVLAELAGATDFSLNEALGCARRNDGTARCWGENDMGQVGDGTTERRLAPVSVRGLHHVAQVAANRDSACARLDDGTVWCWGDNHVGQLGDATRTDRKLPRPVPGVADVVELAAGDLHTCARHRDGTLTCWGWNNHGQCGVGTASETAKPARVAGLERVIQVVATWTHTCALRDDGAVYCWGQGWRGVIGDGMQASRSAPAKVQWAFAPRASAGLPAGVHVDSIAVSSSHTCAVLSDHSVRCWGDNSLGQVTGAGKAADAAEPITVPTPVGKLANVAGLSLELFRSVARLTDGHIVTWGPHKAVEAQPQVASVDDFLMRAPIACVRRADTVTCVGDDDKRITIAKATQLALDHAHVCVLLADHTVACAGYNFRGQLGDGTRTDRWAFAPVASIHDAVEIAVGTEHSCARHADGGVSCWGEASAIGIATEDNALVPIKLRGLGDVVQLAAGGSATCARTRPGAVSCWGRYRHGLGEGTFSATPVEVPWLAGATGFALGLSHSCAVLADGQAACWGENREGQLGDGTMTDREQATPVRW